MFPEKLRDFQETGSSSHWWKVTSIIIVPTLLILQLFITEIIIFYYSSNVLQKVGAVNYCIRCPVGVAGLISPWNLPIYLLTFKIAPAIAAGNTVVCKPSEMTSVTAWMMAKLLNEAGTILHFNSMM